VALLNLGILAHVDAGKTSLTERLLYDAGVVDTIGRVDDGSTRTDSLELERRRGITIKAAVVSFPLREITVNLIDTPGHPDFIAEVERVLGVLDGAVLVVSAVEGVQAQTRVLYRTLRRLAIPTLLFVNKVDRSGARQDGLLAEIRERLTPDIVAMTSVTGGLGTRAAAVAPRAIPAEALAERDDRLLAAYVDGRPVDGRRELPALVGRSRIHPLYFGSAVTGAGVPELEDGIATLLPAADGNAQGPVKGSVFKVERGPAGERLAYVRMFGGTLRVRDKVGEAKVTGISVAGEPRDRVTAGEIGQLRGLPEVRIGDAIGDAPVAGRQFAPPSLETVVVPADRSRKGALQSALAQLADQDPLIDVRQDDVRDELYVSLYGEVQKEVIQATLAEEYGLEVTFTDTTTLCVERPAGVGEAYELIGVAPNPFLATVGLRVSPGAPGSGISFGLAVEPGSMPPAFFKAVEETVTETLRQGLYGWPVPDCTVTMTRSGYSARQSHSHAVFDKSMSSTAGDFRNLTPLVLTEALRRAGTTVLEPVHAFTALVPPDTVPAVLPVLAKLRGIPLATTETGISGEIPAARVHDLVRALPALTRGEGVLENAFDHYEPVHGPAPTRKRTDANPLDRKEYLLRVLRRAGAREQS
jgi:ribosomal protection tetracycline resistance protein